MTEETKKPDELSDEYLPKRQLYHSFSEVIKKIIGEVLDNGEIKIYSISGREKDPEKLKEKIARKAAQGKEYEALEEIEDLAGVRVVTYLESHRNQAENLIYREFEGSQPDVTNKYDPKGYRGTHFVLRLSEAREKLTEYARYKGLKCEVQVVSILYHAWSEIEHDVIYKPGGDREKLASLGLDDIENSFQEIMAQHLEEAAIQFDLLYKKHKEVLRAGEVFYSDFLSDIRNAQSNDEIASILDIGDKFSHKKPEEAVRMAEEVMRITPIDSKVIHEFGRRKIYGKSQESLLKKCIEILKHFHIRYWNAERVLAALFLTAIHESKKVSEEAIKAIEETVKYNNSYIKRYKNLYPQVASLEFIKKIPLEEQRKNLKAITVVAEEILSSVVEGAEWTSADTLTYSSGALVPSEGLKKMRQETISFIVEMYGRSTDLKEQMTLVGVLLTALEAPHNTAYGDELREMIKEDGKRLVAVLEKFIFTSGLMKNYLVAQETEKSLIHLLQSDGFKTDEMKALYDQFQADKDYATFCTLVGDIHEYRNLDEEWAGAEKRRGEEIKALIEDVSEATLDAWYKKLNDFTEPLRAGAIEVWKYTTFKLFVYRLTEEKPLLAATFLTRAVNEGAALAQEPFVSSYLCALRKTNDFKSWDSFVTLISTKKLPALATSIALSLNLDKDVDLRTAVRDADIEILSKLINRKKPFGFAIEDDFSLRYMLMNTLTRLFEMDHIKLESLMIQEMRMHQKFINIYFRELPFASHRKWMSFKDWSEAGIAFIKEQIIALPDLDWHIQEMMLDLGADPLETILGIFKARIMKDKEDDSHYDVIPFHFNPNLQKYIAGHEKYVEEMVGWLKDMTEDWSTYNWNVTHFIQGIGGASYSSILLKLIENSDKKSMGKAAYALQALEGADFNLCFEIVKRTDEEEILGQIAGAMSGTGVVSGEDGMARAYEAKAKELEQYTQSDDERTKNFAIKMKKSFEESAQREYERANIRKKTREIEFKG